MYNSFTLGRPFFRGSKTSVLSKKKGGLDGGDGYGEDGQIKRGAGEGEGELKTATLSTQGCVEAYTVHTLRSAEGLGAERGPEGARERLRWACCAWDKNREKRRKARGKEEKKRKKEEKEMLIIVKVSRLQEVIGVTGCMIHHVSIFFLFIFISGAPSLFVLPMIFFGPCNMGTIW